MSRSTRTLLVSALMALSVSWVGAQTRDVVYGVPLGPTTLEPTQVIGLTDHTIVLAIFGSLVFNFDAVTGEAGYFPYLAEEFEQVAPTVWQVKLREGMTFHDGSPLNAEALAFSLNRILDPEFPSGRYMSTAPIEDVEIVDELTVRIHTERPLAALPGRFLRGDGSVVTPNHYQDGPPWDHVDDTAWDPVGAGPFKFVSYDIDNELILEVFSDFREPRGYDLPNFDRLIFRFIPEVSTMIAEIMRGEVDIATIPPEMVPIIEAAPGVRVVAGPDTTRIAFEMNQTAHPAMGDKRVRQAINYAIDVHGLNEALTGGDGVVIPTLVNPPNDHPDLDPYPYDPERARELLEEAGWGDGFTISIDWSSPPDTGIAAEAMVPYLEAVGIQIESVNALDYTSVFVPRWAEGTLAAIYGYGHGGVEMFAEMDLWTVHPDRTTNSTNWEGPEADRFMELYAQLESAATREEQLQLGYELQELVYEEALSVVFWQMPRYVAVSDRIEFYNPYPGLHNEDFVTIRLAE